MRVMHWCSDRNYIWVTLTESDVQAVPAYRLQHSKGVLTSANVCRCKDIDMSIDHLIDDLLRRVREHHLSCTPVAQWTSGIRNRLQSEQLVRSPACRHDHLEVLSHGHCRAFMCIGNNPLQRIDGCMDQCSPLADVAAQII